MRIKHKIGDYIGADLHFSEANAHALNDIPFLIATGLGAIHSAKFNLMNIQLTQYQPFGLSIIFTISQSHIAMHTYPEHNYMQLEISTCGDNSIQEVFDYILDKVRPLDYDCNEREIMVWPRQV